MCGFVGYIDGGETQLMEPVLHAMADRIRHRGPDWSGIRTTPTITWTARSRSVSADFPSLTSRAADSRF